MYIRRLLFQWATCSTTTMQRSVLVYYIADLNIMSLIFNLLSSWFSWKDVELALHNTHLLLSHKLNTPSKESLDAFLLCNSPATICILITEAYLSITRKWGCKWVRVGWLYNTLCIMYHKACLSLHHICFRSDGNHIYQYYQSPIMSSTCPSFKWKLHWHEH